MTTKSIYTEREIVLRIAKGDQQAFTDLFDRYWNRIYSVALTYIKSTDQAEDITQDVFLILWKRRDTLAEVESLENYLFIITRNEVFRVLRKKGRVLPIEEYQEHMADGQQVTPEMRLSGKELAEVIGNAVQLLPPQQRRAWELSRDQGLSHDQIAEVMGISKNTVKNHIGQALNFIRNYLQSHGDILLFMALWIQSGNF